MASQQQRRVIVLGSTGSIGVNALGVIKELGDFCQVIGLSAHGNIDRLLQQIREYQPEVVSLWEESAAKTLRSTRKSSTTRF